MSDAQDEKIRESEELENTGEAKIDEEAKEDEEEQKHKPLHLRTKTIPTIVMLFGGGAAAIFTFVRHDSLLTSLEIIFVSLVIFLALGDLIKIILDSITIEVPEKEEDNDDKVIEKEGEAREEGENEETEGPPSEEIETNG